MHMCTNPACALQVNVQTGVQVLHMCTNPACALQVNVQTCVQVLVHAYVYQSCLRIAGECADRATTGISLGGVPASCSQLGGFCYDRGHGTRIRAICPKTCDACPGK